MKHRRLPAVLLALILCFTMYAGPALPETAAASDYDEVWLAVGPDRSIRIQVDGFTFVSPRVSERATGYLEP